MKRIVFLFVLLSMVVPGVLFAQGAQENSATNATMGILTLHAPDTLEDAKEGSLNILDKVLAIGPGIIKDVWNNQAMPLWQNMWDWIYQDLWQKRFQPIAQGLWDRLLGLLGREVEQRRPIIEQELEQEKQELADELKTHAENAGKNIWERFKDLFRKN